MRVFLISKSHHKISRGGAYVDPDAAALVASSEKAIRPAPGFNGPGFLERRRGGKGTRIDSRAERSLGAQLLAPSDVGRCPPISRERLQSSRPAGTILPPASSLNDLIGQSQYFGRDCQPQSVGGLEIDEQQEFRRLLDRQVRRLGAFQDLIDMMRGAPE